MSKVNYYLKNAPSEEMLHELEQRNKKAYNEELNVKRPIIMSIAYNGKREFLSTGKSIQLKFWNRNEKRIKNVISTPIESLNDGEWLDSKKIEVENYLKKVRAERRSAIKSELQDIVCANLKPIIENYNLNDIMLEFLNEHKTSDGLSIKLNTKKKYKSLLQHMKDFQGDDSFNPQNYTDKWVEDFRKYLLREKGLNDNSISNIVVRLKSVFNLLKRFSVKGFSPKKDCFNLRGSTPHFFYGENANDALCVFLHAL